TFPPRLLSLISRMEWQDNQAEHWPKPGMCLAYLSCATPPVTVPAVSRAAQSFMSARLVMRADGKRSALVFSSLPTIEFDAEPSVNPSPGADQDPRGLFTIDIDTGDVSVSRSLDREAIDSYELEVSTTDFAGNLVEGPTLLLITVIDQNDNRPIFKETRYTGEVLEGSPT
ncbi:hypothetical protein JOQ06_003321, partial [Pogonophryne albipinna]